jgi:hypothetical protein
MSQSPPSTPKTLESVNPESNEADHPAKPSTLEEMAE